MPASIQTRSVCSNWAGCTGCANHTAYRLHKECPRLSKDLAFNGLHSMNGIVADPILEPPPPETTSMTTRKPRLSQTPLRCLIAFGSIAMGLAGCSSSGPETGLLRPNQAMQPAPTPAEPHTLAASDRLGRLIFGNPSTVAKPKLPSHWTLAQVPVDR